MRLALLFCAAPLFAAPDTAAENFEMKVRPIPANRCYGCHATSPVGGLAAVPGKPEESLLIQVVAHTNDNTE